MNETYDVAVIGGGLAGLAASIQLAGSGRSVILFEKEKYPFHRVCGEYISLESWNFLKELGVPLDGMDLPVIDTLLLTAPNGNRFTTPLPLGGFGISRHQLDARLATIARQKGVHLIEEAKVEEVRFDGRFHLCFESREVRSMVACAAYGKRSNLDIRWKRKFLESSDKRLDNYVGVKYHIKTDWKKNVIGLHNFENGYCGISKIEEDKYCLCYMTKAENLKKCHNSIARLEETVLYKNSHLKEIFTHCEKCFSFPVTISQINFNQKNPVENHLLMLGDSAGMITPLCGNGMSIALHSSKIAAGLISAFLAGEISRNEMEKLYKTRWEQHFAKRLKTGRRLQHFFGSSRLSNGLVALLKLLPFLSKPLIRMTHGKPF